MRHSGRRDFKRTAFEIQHSEGNIRWYGNVYHLNMIIPKYTDLFDSYEFHLKEQVTFVIRIYDSDYIDTEYAPEEDLDYMQVFITRGDGDEVHFEYF